MATQSGATSRAKNKKTAMGSGRARGHAAATASTKGAVLDAAMIVLARDGHAKFTVRRVAEAAGISSGHMMYHYPTKQLLMRALISSRLERDEADFTRAVLNLASPAERAISLMRFLIDIGLDDGLNKLFRQFHAVAAQDTVVARLLATYYERAIVVATDAIWQSSSSVSKDQVAAVVQLMAVISEGTGLLRGLPFKHAIDPDLIADHAARLIGSVLGHPQ